MKSGRAYVHDLLLFDNLLSWSAEIAILVIAAGAAAYALRHPRARLYFWQAILAVALILPAIAPWKQPVEVALPSSAPTAMVTQVAPPSCAGIHALGSRAIIRVPGCRRCLRLVWVAWDYCACLASGNTPSLCRIFRWRSAEMRVGTFRIG